MWRHAAVGIALLALSLAAAACAGKPAPPPAPPPLPVTIEDMTWIATDVLGRPVPDGARIVFYATRSGRITGETSCNGYVALGEIKGEELKIDLIGLEEATCASPVASLEKDFVVALASVRQWRVADGILTLIDEEDGAVAVLTPWWMAPPEADGRDPKAQQ